MIRCLLQEIEKSPQALFSKRELCSLSEPDYEHLIKKKLLAYFRPAETDLERTARRCQHGCPLTIIQNEHGIEGVCLEHPEEDPVAIQEDELCRYSFSLPTFLELIRAANQLEGSLHLIDGDILYMGYKNYDRQRVGIVYVPNVGRDKLSQMLGIKRLCGEDDYLVVVNPFTKVEEIPLRTNLHQNKILQLSLADCLNTQTFEMPLDTIIAGIQKKDGKENTAIALDLSQFSDNKAAKHDFKQEMTQLANQGYIKYRSRGEATKAAKRIRERLNKSKYASIKLKQEKTNLRLCDGIQVIIKK